MRKFLNKSVSKKQASDSGMALVLIFLLTGYFSGNDFYYKIAVPVLILNLVFPLAYYPFALLWFGLSAFLGTYMSKIVLSGIFMLLVLPVGLIRRALGKDTLDLKRFKEDQKSVMKERNYVFTPLDIERPY